MMAVLAFASSLLSIQDEDIRPPELKQLEEQREEVRILALFQAAKLTQEQAASLLDLVSKAAESLKELAAQYQDQLTEALEVLKEAKAALAKGEDLPEDLRRRVEELQRNAGKTQQTVAQQLAPLMEELRKILTAEQIVMITAAPRADVWGPFRKQLEDGIGQIRQLSDNDFDLSVPDLLEQQLEKISERFGGMNNDEFEKEHTRILDILREARKLDDDEFRDKNTSLVNRILGEGKLGEFGKKAAPAGGGGGGGNATENQGLGRFIFNPMTVRALKTRAGK
ncbi:MAG TPA: hypothetical protein VI643_04795 [Planctomycetota bacterium]|nr:hypothetical protein [Planctomycetota bacterium]